MRGKNCSAHGTANTAEFNKRVEGRNGFSRSSLERLMEPKPARPTTGSLHIQYQRALCSFDRRQDRILGGLC